MPPHWPTTRRDVLDVTRDTATKLASMTTTEVSVVSEARAARVEPVAPDSRPRWRRVTEVRFRLETPQTPRVLGILAEGRDYRSAG